MQELWKKLTDEVLKVLGIYGFVSTIWRLSVNTLNIEPSVIIIVVSLVLTCSLYANLLRWPDKEVGVQDLVIEGEEFVDE